METRPVVVDVTCDDVRCFISPVLIELGLCDLYLTKFDLTKGLLFDTFFITGFYKSCRCDR